jgi:hypothetical protein
MLENTKGESRECKLFCNAFFGNEMKKEKEKTCLHTTNNNYIFTYYTF